MTDRTKQYVFDLVDINTKPRSFQDLKAATDPLPYFAGCYKRSLFYFYFHFKINMDTITRAKQSLRICYELKSEQLTALRAFIEGRDIVCLLPTGFGKSVIFQMMPFLSEDPMACVIVISPLNAIMKDQVRKLCENGIPACFLDITGRDGSTFKLKHVVDRDPVYILAGDVDEHDYSSNDDIDEDTGQLHIKVSKEEVAAGKFRLIYAHPEAFLSSKDGRKILQSKALQDHICGICIDEAHMIHEWGEDFRKDFSRIQELLAIFPKVPVSLFTATASKSTKEKLVKNLGLKNPLFITKNPDRPNIKYHKYERLSSIKQENDLDKILGEIASGLLKDRKHYPLTFIYTDLESIRYGYRFLEKLSKSEPVIRVVLATVALGIGMHAPAVRKVIHFKCPTSIEKYLQETGRAERDGLPADAILYVNKTDVRKNRPGMQNSMRQYCTSTDTCLRLQLLQHLDYKPEEGNKNCKCCSVCDILCNCTDCEL
ncbi:ATP-dependent DNA helicase RecQ-like [Ostrea edulis]|uniref:ATP-dependent DNA helicase RecQ-like n=1 Tax=Ostrea edulis TaxID=37623 RepID=UPI0024AEC733|nr:ATP-dependent DNA helicase RecQ-like [Ostrea edulis]